MSTIIRTRSPFFIRTPSETSTSLSYFQIVVTILSGVSDTVPCGGIYNSYTLQKKPIGDENSVSFDISEIVNDSLEQKIHSVTGYMVSAKTQSAWVNVTTSARQSDGTIIGSATTNTYLAQEGYNKFLEGVNYVAEPNAMITSNYIRYKKGNAIYLPVNTETVNSVQFKNNGSNVGTATTVTDSTNSETKIKYVSFNTVSQATDEVVVTYNTSSTRTIKIEEVEECKYQVNKILFVNRWGALQDLYFFKKSTESFETSKEQFNRSLFQARTVNYTQRSSDNSCVTSTSYNNYNNKAHANKTFNANGKESISLNTGFVSEIMNDSFEELMLSEYIWMIDSSNVIYPINLKESSFTKKTGLNDKLINYTMNFEKSFNMVNNIR